MKDVWNKGKLSVNTLAYFYNPAVDNSQIICCKRVGVGGGGEGGLDLS